MIIMINNAEDHPYYWQIYRQIRERIISGKLTEGSKLHSTRMLAKDLKIARNTVERAYLQLWSEGYIVANKSRSKFVVQALDNILYANETVQKIENNQRLPDNTPAIKYDFQYGKMMASDFPLYLWRRISNKCLAPPFAEKMTYYNEHQGEQDLQVAIREYLYKSRNVVCQPNQIVICSGIHSCLGLLSQLFRDHTTDVAVEDPGYDGARNVFKNNGYRVFPVGLRDSGIDRKKLERSRAKIVYVTPSHQFPTGSIMPIQKRFDLLDWAVRTNGIVIEDDYDSELRYNSRPIPSMQGIDRNNSVVYTGTFSKVLSPALRLSFFVLPKPWLEVFQIKFKNYHSSVPWLQQKVLQQFMSLGYWDSHLRKICLANKKKHDLLVKTIHELMGNHVIIHGRNAGLHIMLEINNGLTEDELINRACKYGVAVYPVSKYWMRPKQYTNNMVLIGFSGINEKDIIKGIRNLYHSWFCE